MTLTGKDINALRNIESTLMRAALETVPGSVIDRCIILALEDARRIQKRHGYPTVEESAKG